MYVIYRKMVIFIIRNRKYIRFYYLVLTLNELVYSWFFSCRVGTSSTQKAISLCRFWTHETIFYDIPIYRGWNTCFGRKRASSISFLTLAVPTKTYEWKIFSKLLSVQRIFLTRISCTGIIIERITKLFCA